VDLTRIPTCLYLEHFLFGKVTRADTNYKVGGNFFKRRKVPLFMFKVQ
jgi:hypothetical protein